MKRLFVAILLFPMLVFAEPEVADDVHQTQLLEIRLLINEALRAEQTRTEQRKRSAEESFKKAERFSRDKQYETAGMYYGNAIALDPENTAVLQSYTNTIMQWVEFCKATGKHSVALQTLTDYIRFIYTYPHGLPIDGADFLVSTFWRLKEYQEKLAAEIDSISQLEEQKQFSELQNNIKTALARPVPSAESALADEFRQLQVLFARHSRVGGDTKQADALNRRIQMVADNLEALNLLQYGEDILARNIGDIGTGAFFAASELQITNQRLLSLKPSLTAEITARAVKFGADVQNLSGSINTDSARAVWNRLDKRRADIVRLAGAAKTKEEAIRIWSAFSEDLSLEMPRMAATPYGAQIRALMGQAADNITTLRDNQMSLYEKWALRNIRSMHESYNSEVGLISRSANSKTRIYNGLMDYMCAIDTRFLSINGLKLYNDIFDFFSRELDREQRINLTLEFNECRKRAIGEF